MFFLYGILKHMRARALPQAALPASGGYLRGCAGRARAP